MGTKVHGYLEKDLTKHVGKDSKVTIERIRPH